MTLTWLIPLRGQIPLAITKHFFWPGLKSDVICYCHTWQNQLTNQIKESLFPVPVAEEPFQRVIVDCVGPKSKTGFQFLLTVMCASTRFPEAIPLRRITAQIVVKALVRFFSTFGLPKAVQTDHWSVTKAPTLSWVFDQALKTLGIEHITSSPYRPERQGVLKRFDQTWSVHVVETLLQFSAGLGRKCSPCVICLSWS